MNSRRLFETATSALFISLAIQPAHAAEQQPRLAESATVSRNLLNAELSEILEREAGRQGFVKVVLRLTVPFAPELLLSEAERSQQRRDIAKAAFYLKKRLPQQWNVTSIDHLPYVEATLREGDIDTLRSLDGVSGVEISESFNWLHNFVRLRVMERTREVKAARPLTNRASKPTERIVGGTDAEPSTHPFQVGLLAKSVEDNFYAQFCGGTLVSSQYVVTAAHCSDFVHPTEVQVLVGTQRLDGSGQRVNVTSVTVHPNWNTRTDNYDVAVWKLSAPVTGLSFATLATTQPTTAGVALRATGWGTLWSEGERSETLQQVDVPYVPTVGRACQYQRGITAQMLCAGEAGKDSCQGDSGGPLTMNNGSGYTVLAGVVSFGTGCGDPGYPGVYANVASSNIHNFIISNTTSPTSENVIEFSVSNVSVSEEQRTVTLTVQRSSRAGTATVRYITSNNTAVSPSDYRSKTGTVRFARNTTTAKITISLKNDRVREGDESFFVNLSNPSSGFSIGETQQAIVSIADDD